MVESAACLGQDAPMEGTLFMNHVPAARWSRPAALLCGAALMTLATVAAAQAPAPRSAPATTPTPSKPDMGPDGLGTDGFYLEADEVIRNDADDTVTARGEVEARRGGL